MVLADADVVEADLLGQADPLQDVPQPLRGEVRAPVTGSGWTSPNVYRPSSMPGAAQTGLAAFPVVVPAAARMSAP